MYALHGRWCAAWRSGQHAIRFALAVNCLVEEATWTDGEVVRCEGVKSASHVNGAVAVFLDSAAEVSDAAETGVVVHDTFNPVLQLVSAANMKMSSNAPSCIKNSSSLLPLLEEVVKGC